MDSATNRDVRALPLDKSGTRFAPAILAVSAAVRWCTMLLSGKLRCIACLLAALPAGAIGQSASAGQPLVHSTSTFVLVPVRAQSESGAPVRNLAAEQLRLTDNGMPQNVVDVRTADLPISLVILMQTGGAGKQRFASYFDIVRLIDTLLGSSGHEITFATFDSKVEEIWNFPAHSDGLKWSLQHPHSGDGGAAILDAVSFGVRQLQAQPGRFRRFVLLLSQQSDDASQTPPQDLMQQLGTASTMVYSLTFPVPRTGRRKAMAARAEANSFSPELARAARLLRSSSATEIAELTGGARLAFADRPSFDAALLQVAGDIANTSTVGFQPNPTAPGFHILRVESKSPRSRISIQARTAYWFVSPGGQQ
jgi:VWFA-related protein